jgi:hypothetical protein
VCLLDPMDGLRWSRPSSAFKQMYCLIVFFMAPRLRGLAISIPILSSDSLVPFRVTFDPLFCLFLTDGLFFGTRQLLRCFAFSSRTACSSERVSFCPCLLLTGISWDPPFGLFLHGGQAYLAHEGLFLRKRLPLVHATSFLPLVSY